jgi:hypothetical protein
LGALGRFFDGLGENSWFSMQPVAEATQIDYWMISGLFFYRRFRLNQTASGKASFSGGHPSQKRLQNEGRITRFLRDYHGLFRVQMRAGA